MIVRDLFFNTPARRKFLKSDRAEGAACAAAALRCALGRPDVSVRCIRDGEELFFSPGDNKLDSCVYSLLGRELAKTLLPCESEVDGVRVHGFISSPAAGRGSRAQQHFFCNGRWIRSAALQAALEQAYRNQLLQGRFPACVLHLHLPEHLVDVNVHPAKKEVRFRRSADVVNTIVEAIANTLQKHARQEIHAAAPEPERTLPPAHSTTAPHGEIPARSTNPGSAFPAAARPSPASSAAQPPLSSSS